ncbi:nickel transporter permease [Berryella wangjianweii]|uniref:nickel transporter permease n=1 Tax=Berryella wangjianweii TaxID=2734634 RepID=UPI0021BD8F8C|nr:nickel transporter permease [Berryella wangjianweii]
MTFGALTALLVLVAVLAVPLAPHDPYAQDLAQALRPPGPDHWAGTDRLGRDLFSRVLVGAQTSLFWTLLLVAVVSCAGTAVGVACAWRPGRLDSLAMRVSDVFLAFPGLVFALAVAAVLGGGMHNAVLALALISWPKYARIARGLALTQRSALYVRAARMAGCTEAQVIARHVLPNIAGPVLVTAVLDIGTMMMELAALSFLGLGAQPPAAEWGSMMSDNRNLMQTNPWAVVAPGMAIFVAVLTFNLLGDALRDAIDPSQRTASSADDDARPGPSRGAGGLAGETGKAGAPMGGSTTGKESGMALMGKTARRWGALVAAVCLVGALGLAGCGQTGSQAGQSAGGASDPQDKKVVYGTTSYGVAMDDAGLNPHSAYSGWSCVRYGVGETLFRFSDDMRPEPWLATGYEFLDDTRCRITLRTDVKFSSGRALDAQAVKECLEALVANHDRAPGELNIQSIEAEGNQLTITTSKPTPALVNYLCDPYAAIIDMQAGVSADQNVSGTGPYVATEVSDTQITLKANAAYRDGAPKVGTVVVRSITDFDTLANALQSGEVNAASGIQFANYPLFRNDGYRIEQRQSNRVFFAQLNHASPIMADPAVRAAVARGIDRQGFVDALLQGNGAVADGPFSQNLPFGGKAVTAPAYDPDEAMRLLEEAGWVDEDGDGVREKDGQRLTLRWLTYPGRAELPLLAESAQATLRKIGFDVQVNSTASHIELRKKPDAWDVYASTLVTAPTGDPAYFFRAFALDKASKNFGGYHSDALEAQAAQLQAAFDPAERAALGTRMAQTLLDDNGYVFAAHSSLGMVCQAGVTGLVPHPCDYYELSADLDISK